MRVLNSDQFFPTAGAPYGTFKAATSRGEVALAFGTDRALAGGRFLDLDAVAWMLVDELTPAFTRKFAAIIVRTFSDQWCEAVSSADQVAEPVFFLVLESGDKLTGKMRGHREGINVASCTLAQLAEQQLEHARTIPDRITLVNVSSILRRVRENAKKIGLDLSAPFCPPLLDDPEFERMRRETKESREKLVGRVSKEAQP